MLLSSEGEKLDVREKTGGTHGCQVEQVVRNAVLQEFTGPRSFRVDGHEFHECTGHWACPRCLGIAAPAPVQPPTSRFVSEPQYHQCRKTLRIQQWNAGGLSTKQHELRLLLKDDSFGISLIKEAKLLSKDTTASSRDFVR